MTDADVLLPAALAGLTTTAVLSLATWLASLARRDASLVDRMWPVFIVGSSFVGANAFMPATGRAVGALALSLTWGARLCVYITRRNWGHGEDRRYADIRARNQPNFGIKSLYLIFGLQAVLAWGMSLPVMIAAAGVRPLGMFDATGLTLAAFGIVFESVADVQMARFQADPDHRHRVMDRGLWRYSRHPNYFGETCVWWGLWLTALGGSGPGAAWSVIAPLLMTVLLLKVSGVSLLERNIAERRPAYQCYIERTRAFVPGPPRTRGPCSL